MPRNKKERVVYIALLCLQMTWILGILSGMLNAGRVSLQAVRAATVQEPAVFLFAFAIAYLGVQKASAKAAFHFITPADSENAKILACSFFMVLFMSPLVLLFRLTLANGFPSPMLWLTTWLRGFTMALFLNLTLAGPVARFILRKLRKS